MENKKETTLIMKEKLETLKKNLEAVGREALRTRYGKAYQKLLSELTELNKEIMRKEIMFLDLSLVSEDKRGKFKNIIENRQTDIKTAILNGNYEDYLQIIQEVALVYTSFWCDNVIQSHKEGEPYIFNPFSLEETA